MARNAEAPMKCCLVEVWYAPEGKFSIFNREPKWFVGFVVTPADLTQIPLKKKPGYRARVVSVLSSVKGAMTKSAERKRWR